MQLPRRYWRNLDLPLIISVSLLIAIGIFVIYSASASRLINQGEDPFYFVQRQAIFALIGFVAMFVTLSIDYRAWRRWTRLMYLINVILLGSVLFIGPAVSGSQRWFRIGSFAIQPSEIAKIIVIVVLARVLEKHENFTGYKILYPFLIVSIPMGLILLQPDMGTSMVFLGIVFSMLYFAGAKVKHLLVTATTGLAAVVSAILVSYWEISPIIKPYQLNRLLVFLNPYSDKTHSGWNIIQSMIAVGSGGFLGKGFLSGSQSQLHFLPANHTDFVFSVIAEEFGFVGAILILLLYLFFIWRGLRLALLAKDRFGMLLITGCVSLFLFHLIINVGMSIGIMPVTGLPLPFITYGGSTLFSNLIAVGIILNVGLRRTKIMF